MGLHNVKQGNCFNFSFGTFGSYSSSLLFSDLTDPGIWVKGHHINNDCNGENDKEQNESFEFNEFFQSIKKLWSMEAHSWVVEIIITIDDVIVGL